MADVTGNSAQIRLMHLVSPSLPIGGFTYSQGLEWAVEAGWIRGAEDLSNWLEGLLETTQVRVDIPILIHLYRAWAVADEVEAKYWSRLLLTWRETRELRFEESSRGRALANLLISLGVEGANRWQSTLALCQPAGFALAAQCWGIPSSDAARGYLWSWLENQVIAAIKLVPFGQTEGQRVLHGLVDRLAAGVEQGMILKDHEIGAASPSMAIASCLHETQYTRLFRS